MWTITFLRFKRDRRGVSNIIVVVLSLVIILAIVSNIVLWNYEMNQVDWEKMKEEAGITNVQQLTTGSSWNVVQEEFTINLGSQTGGTYVNTQTIDGNYESFTEVGSSSYVLDLTGEFNVDLSTYPVEEIQTVEIQLRYRTNDSTENWYLKAYNWTSSTYSDVGFNSTSGHTPTTGWDYYSVNLTDVWQSYVHSNGTILVKFVDQSGDVDQTGVEIDFLGVRIKMAGTQFTIKNDGALTLHLVSLWITNSTTHERYDINLFVNSAATKNYLRSDISLPAGSYTVKFVSERGNIAVFSGIGS